MAPLQVVSTNSRFRQSTRKIVSRSFLKLPVCSHQQRREQADGYQFSRVSLELMSQILQHVPQGQRLTSCATVCQAFAAAAAAATTSIEKEGFACKMLCHTQQYLQHHGKQLKSLKLKPLPSGISQLRPPSAELQLPCAELQQLSCLQLSNLQLQLPDAQGPSTTSSITASNPSSSSQAPAHLMPKLQELKLKSCWMSPSTALKLSQLTALTRLKLWDTCQVTNMVPLNHDTVKRILQPLTRLQRLKLQHNSSTDMAGMVASISSSVTALSVSAQYWLEPALPFFPQLTQLQKLKLAHVSFSPVILASFPQLWHLQPQDCTFVRSLLSGVPGALYANDEFLAVVRELRHLQHLSVCNYEVGFAHVNAVDCPALTASSSLTHLEIFCGEEQPLPDAALQDMFPAGKALPRLQHLALSCSDRRDHWHHAPGAALMTPAELCSILLRVCPAICSLDIENALSPLAGDSRQQFEDALLQLPASCCSLRVGGDPFDDAAAAMIMQLSQLTSLHWSCADGLTDAGLERLTALQGLQLLSLHKCLNNEVVPKDEDTMWDVYEIKAAEQPVWQQLKRLIDRLPSNGGWMKRLEQQQQQAADTARDEQQTLSHYMDHALDVMMFCAGNAQALQAARDMIDVGRKVLSGPAAGDGFSAAVQQFEELCKQVKHFCSTAANSSSRSEVLDGLQCMQDTVCA